MFWSTLKQCWLHEICANIWCAWISLNIPRKKHVDTTSICLSQLHVLNTHPIGVPNTPDIRQFFFQKIKEIDNVSHFYNYRNGKYQLRKCTTFIAQGIAWSLFRLFSLKLQPITCSYQLSADGPEIQKPVKLNKLSKLGSQGIASGLYSLK